MVDANLLPPALNRHFGSHCLAKLRQGPMLRALWLAKSAKFCIRIASRGPAAGKNREGPSLRRASVPLSLRTFAIFASAPATPSAFLPPRASVRCLPQRTFGIFAAAGPAASLSAAVPAGPRAVACDKELITDYAAAFGQSASEFMRTAALERIEDELDLKTWEQAKAEFDADPQTVSAAEIAGNYL